MIIFLAIGCWLLSLFLQELIIPYTNRRAKEIYTIEIKRKKRSKLFVRNNFWYKSRDTICHIEFFDSQKKLLEGVSLFWFSPDFVLRKRVDAKRAVWKSDRWILEEGIVREFSSSGKIITKRFSEMIAPLVESPEDFKQAQKEPQEMNYRELKGFVKRAKLAGYNVGPYEVEMESKLSYPFICVIMGILGIPFALKASKAGGLAVEIGISIALGFCYWLFYAFSLSLGKGGTLPPLVSAWIANFTFGCLGVYLFLRVRQ